MPQKKMQKLAEECKSLADMILVLEGRLHVRCQQYKEARDKMRELRQQELDEQRRDQKEDQRPEGKEERADKTPEQVKVGV